MLRRGINRVHTPCKSDIVTMNPRVPPRDSCAESDEIKRAVRAALNTSKFRFLHQAHGAFGKFATRGDGNPEAQGMLLKGNSHHE